MPMSARISLANALVSSNLDYCNSLLTGINKSNILKLQRVQNSLARAITNATKYEHITLVLLSCIGFLFSKEFVSNWGS